jgi:hypothetical protein
VVATGSLRRQTLSVGTPLFFDIGVFLVVLGTILTLVLKLEER